MHDLCRKSPPNPNDRAYFPIDNDLKNHLYMDKALQLSCLDQENVRLKIDQWKIYDPESTHFFRPDIINDVKDVDTSTPAYQPTQNKTEGHFNGNNGGDGFGIITDITKY